jgi:hypothetical protein
MDWLTDAVTKKEEELSELDLDGSPYIEEYDVDDDLGDVPIPTTGISVADEMEAKNKDRFTTDLVPIKGLGPGVNAAQLVTTATLGSLEPVRYIVGLSKQQLKSDSAKKTSKTAKTAIADFVMIDVPPFSDELAANIRAYMGLGARLAAILVTNRESIHYDEAPAVFAMRRTDFKQWKNAFENIQVVAYRLDIPRDCTPFITQRLDGYGPFAMDTTNLIFTETGRPLTYEEWDHDVAEDIMTRGKAPPDDKESEDGENQNMDDDQYSPEAIRAREEDKRVLAIYTPGHSYGSVTYIFPETQLCCSGFTIPVEDTRRDDENPGMSGAGPALDFRGYITTSKMGITRQMKSARGLINTYIDRFTVVMPSRGDPLFLDGLPDERKAALLDVVDDYEKIGKIYEQLGITNYGDGNDS